MHLSLFLPYPYKGTLPSVGVKFGVVDAELRGVRMLLVGDLDDLTSSATSEMSLQSLSQLESSETEKTMKLVVWKCHEILLFITYYLATVYYKNPLLLNLPNVIKNMILFPTLPYNNQLRTGHDSRPPSLIDLDFSLHRPLCRPT